MTYQSAVFVLIRNPHPLTTMKLIMSVFATGISLAFMIAGIMLERVTMEHDYVHMRVMGLSETKVFVGSGTGSIVHMSMEEFSVWPSLGDDVVMKRSGDTYYPPSDPMKRYDMVSRLLLFFSVFGLLLTSQYYMSKLVINRLEERVLIQA